MNDRILIFDTTLRDGEQAPGASMTIPEKVDIAHALADLGVDIIEAGFPVSSPIQAEGIAQICSEVEGPVICALARAKEGDLVAAKQSLKGSTNNRIHTFIGTSDIHIDGKFGQDKYGVTLAEKRETVIRMAVEAVGSAKEFTGDVEFSAEDAGRTDRGYLVEIVSAAVEAGATTINLPDTTGFCFPSEYAELIRSVMEQVDAPDVTYSTHCHDDLGLAVANSIAGIIAGARQIECTINGIGERAGNAALEEIVMALRVRKDVSPGDTNIVSKSLMSCSQLVSNYSGFLVQPNKAVVGRNAFSHEAGIHQDGVLKRRDTYEIMSAADVGQDGEQIRLGRHSGRHGFFSRLEAMGFSIQDDHKVDLYQRFLQLADEKKEVYEEDLVHLVGSIQGKDVEETFVLEHMDIRTVTGSRPSAEVRIRNTSTDEVSVASGVGDGPVDASYRAIGHAIVGGHKLLTYNIASVTEGQDALGVVSVQVEFGGREFQGRATDTDILKASVQAYINALNQVENYRDSQRWASQTISDLSST